MNKDFLRKIFSAVFFCVMGVAVFAAGKASVKTEVQSIDKHGNVNLLIQGNVFSAKGFSVTDIVTVKAGNASFTAPVVKNYSDVDTGEYVVRVNDMEVSLAINMGNFASTTGVTVGTPVSITLKEKNGYLLKYQIHVLQKVTDRQKASSDESFANFRAVKAGGIAEGKLFRSASPVIEDEHAPYAASLVEQNSISTVLNLSDSAESVQETISAAPYYATLSQNGSVCFLNMGASYTDEAFARKFAEGIRFMISNPAPYLVHGKEGKIRTGFVCAVLEALCGASMNEITQDYMQSFVDYNGIRTDSPQYKVIAQGVPAIFAQLNGGKKISDKDLKKIATNYLVKKAGLTEKEVNQLTQILCAKE